MMGHRRFQEAKNLLDRLDESCEGDEEKSRMRRYVAWGNFCYVLYHIFYWGFVFVNFTGYILMGRHAWRMYNPFLDSEENFYTSSFSEFLLMSAVVTMDQCTDVSPLTHVLMARCHITLLKDRLSRLRQDLRKSEDEHYSDLTKCIKDHRFILK